MHFFKAHLRACCKIESVLVNDMSDLQRLVGSSHQPLYKKGRHHCVKSRVPYFNCKVRHAMASKIERKSIYKRISTQHISLPKQWMLTRAPRAKRRLQRSDVDIIFLPTKAFRLTFDINIPPITYAETIRNRWFETPSELVIQMLKLRNQPPTHPTFRLSFQALKVVQFHHPSENFKHLGRTPWAPGKVG